MSRFSQHLDQKCVVMIGSYDIFIDINPRRPTSICSPKLASTHLLLGFSGRSTNLWSRFRRSGVHWD